MILGTQLVEFDSLMMLAEIPVFGQFLMQNPVAHFAAQEGQLTKLEHLLIYDGKEKKPFSLLTKRQE